MYYEITVSINGRHLFATAERSIIAKWQLDIIYDIFKRKFPAEEGYKISITKWEKTGKFIEMEDK